MLRTPESMIKSNLVAEIKAFNACKYHGYAKVTSSGLTKPQLVVAVKQCREKAIAAIAAIAAPAAAPAASPTVSAAAVDDNCDCA